MRTMIATTGRWTLFLYLSLLFGQAAAASTDPAAEAKQAYTARNYNKAAALFEGLIKKSPRDGMLHYYYANCLLAKHDHSEAAAEYSIAGQLFKDQKMKDYCFGLAEQFQYQPPEPKSNISAPNIPEKILTSTHTDDPTKNEKIRSILRRGEMDANKVMNDANRQITPLNQEMSDISSWGSVHNRGGGMMMSPTEVDNAQQGLNDRANQLRELARRQAQDVREQAKRDAERVAK